MSKPTGRTDDWLKDFPNLVFTIMVPNGRFFKKGKLMNELPKSFREVANILCALDQFDPEKSDEDNAKEDEARERRRLERKNHGQRAQGP